MPNSSSKTQAIPTAIKLGLDELLSLIASLALAIPDVERRRKALREQIAQRPIFEGLRHYLSTTSPETLRPKRLLFHAAVAATVLEVEERAWVERGLLAIDKPLKKHLLDQLNAQGCTQTSLIVRAVVDELGSSRRLPTENQKGNAHLVDLLSETKPNPNEVAKQLLAIAEDQATKIHLRHIAAALIGDPVLVTGTQVTPPQNFDPADLRRLRQSLLGNRDVLLAAHIVCDAEAARSSVPPLEVRNEFQRHRIHDNVRAPSIDRTIPLEPAPTSQETESEDLDQSAAGLVARGSAGQSYREIASGLDRVRDAVSRGVARRLESAIKAELPNRPFATFEDKKNVAHWLNDELRHFDLAIRSPKTGQPARIKVATGRTASNGFIQIVADLGGSHSGSTNCSTIPDLIKVIAFVEAPARREGLRDWRSRVNSESEAAKRGGSPG